MHIVLILDRRSMREVGQALIQAGLYEICESTGKLSTRMQGFHHRVVGSHPHRMKGHRCIF